MRTLVIGYGSIGQRHARILAELGNEVAVVSRRAVEHEHVYPNIAEALASFEPGYVVIASHTSEHRTDMELLAANGFAGRLLVEKPVFNHGADMPAGRFESVKIAYNLRFHPAVIAMREHLAGKRAHTVAAYVGSYLPDWRPGNDYRETSSAKRAYGGGVLRELSHDIDYLLWWLGDCRRVTAVGGHFSALDVETDDVFALLFETERADVVTLQMNYLDKPTRREVVVVTEDGSYRLDLVAGTLDTPSGTETYSVDRDDTYRAEHQAMLAGDASVICDLQEGLAVMRMIDAAEAAAADKIWVAA